MIKIAFIYADRLIRTLMEKKRSRDMKTRLEKISANDTVLKREKIASINSPKS